MAAEKYNEAERELLRQAREMREIFNSKAWKVYSEIVESQIKTREALIMDSAPGTLDSLQLEHIKGARLGLRLALDTISLIITDANDLAAQGQDTSEEDN